MPPTSNEVLAGGCDCGQSRYQLTGRPMFVNCCHCRWCQRETGSAFALNAMYESHLFKLTNPDSSLETTTLPTQSGKPQRLYRCPSCKVVLYSLYGDNGDYIRFVKVSTLENPDVLPPGAHIFTMSKQPWLNLEDGAPQFEEFYKRPGLWSKESLERIGAVVATMKKDRAAKAEKSKL